MPGLADGEFGAAIGLTQEESEEAPALDSAPAAGILGLHVIGQATVTSEDIGAA